MEAISRRSFNLAAAAALSASSTTAAAQTAPLDVRAIVIAAADALRAQYVDPDGGERLASLLLQRLEAGAYATPSRQRLAERLTADLRAETHDLHLEVSYEPPAPTRENPSEIPEDAQHPRTTAWGVQTVARLQGNVGLLRITHFPSPYTRVAQRYAAAMELLQDTAALILDLTTNHGGGTDTYGFFLSYFLDGEIELGRMNWRNDPVEIIKTFPDAPGPHYGVERPLYVAISGETFSAGEAVAFQLKARQRATLIGARTKGGAHAGNFVDLPDHFRIFVVMGRGEGQDWEGAGVAPNVEARAAQAVPVAHRMALRALQERAADPMRAQILRNVQNGEIENLSSFPEVRRGGARL